MEELGRKLKHVREKRGVSLRDIAERTKISLTSLEALERSEFSRMPGGIFGRSVVRAYATEVGLDPDTTVENFLAYVRRHEQQAAEREAAARPDVTRDDQEYLDRQRQAARLLRLGIVSLVISGVTLVAWQVIRIWTPRDPLAARAHVARVRSQTPTPPRPAEAAPAPAGAAAPVAAAPAPRADLKVGPSPAAAVTPQPDPKVGSSTASTAPTVAPRVEAVGSSTDSRGARADRRTTLDRRGAAEPAPAEPAAVEARPAVSRPAAAPAPVPTALVLHLTARADCEISVVRDGGPVESQVLRAGGRLRVDATSDVALTVADAGAVTWRINGRSARPLGRAGAEASVRVTRENAAAFLR
jgi:cytoskeletal protein RodZ